MGELRLTCLASVLCTLLAFVFCSIGLFIKLWWQNVDNNDQTYGLFTVVNCTKDLCVLVKNGASNEGFIVFVQAAALVQFIMLIASVGFQALGFICRNMWLVIAASGALGFSSLASVLQVCVLSPMYMKLTEAYVTTIERPNNYVIYTTLPVGMLALSGSLCIPAFVSIVIYRTQERKLRLEQTDK